MHKIVMRTDVGGGTVGKERVTIQLRKYDEDGKYVKGPSHGEGNETIWLLMSKLPDAYELVKSALLNCPYIKSYTVDS